MDCSEGELWVLLLYYIIYALAPYCCIAFWVHLGLVLLA